MSVRAAALTARRTWLKALRRPVHLSFSLVQPLTWLLFFGVLMQRFAVGKLPPGVDYVSFLTPAVAAMTVLFGASQAGIGLLRDMQNGFLQRVLRTAAPRHGLHAGKVLGDAARLLLQALAVLAVAAVLGARLDVDAGACALAAAALFLFAYAFASLSCAIAMLGRRQETMAAYVHIVNMPVFFTSTALVPKPWLPEWLAAVAAWNPLSLVVDALRAGLLGLPPGNAAPTLAMLGGLAVCCHLLAVRTLRRALNVHPWEVR